MITEITKSYIAGFVDGEGTITATYQHRNGYPRVSIFNTDLRPLKFVYYLYKSSIVRVKQAETENSKAMYYLSIFQSDMVRFLSDIYPFLICKKKQAKYAIKLRSLIHPKYGSSYKNCHKKERKLLVNKIQKLNFRGKPRYKVNDIKTKVELIEKPIIASQTFQ